MAKSVFLMHTCLSTSSLTQIILGGLCVGEAEAFSCVEMTQLSRT